MNTAASGPKSASASVWKLALALLTLLAFSAVVWPGGSRAASTNPNAATYLALYMGHGDYIVNYDHLSPSFGRTNVDWATHILFYVGAIGPTVVDAVKYPYEGSAQWGAYNDGPQNNSQWGWIGSAGRKKTLCTSNDNHYRLYGNPAGANYNIDFGFYTYATIHRDQNECPGGLPPKFGYSENAEAQLATEMISRGYNVAQNYASFSNPEPDRLQGVDHFWRSNGLGTAIPVA
jgi:hypothetical protein